MNTYDASKVQVNIGGLILTGFADGTFVKSARTTPENYKKKVGAKGEVSRSKTCDRSGNIEVTLKHTSPANAKLQVLASSPATFPITVIENSSQKIVIAANEAWIEKEPESEFAEEEGNSVWVIGCADLSKTIIPA